MASVKHGWCNLETAAVRSNCIHDEALLGLPSVTELAGTELNPDRAEILRLRARVVVVERAARAALELMLRIRPEQLDTILKVTRKHLSEAYLDAEFAPDLNDARERAFVADEVERLMRDLQTEMGFGTGKSPPEQG